MRNRGIKNVTVAVVPNLHLFSSRRVNEDMILSARARVSADYSSVCTAEKIRDFGGKVPPS
jgi:hypothetical protein